MWIVGGVVNHACPGYRRDRWSEDKNLAKIAQWMREDCSDLERVESEEKNGSILVEKPS